MTVKQTCALFGVKKLTGVAVPELDIEVLVVLLRFGQNHCPAGICVKGKYPRAGQIGINPVSRRTVATNAPLQTLLKLGHTQKLSDNVMHRCSTTSRNWHNSYI